MARFLGGAGRHESAAFLLEWLWDQIVGLSRAGGGRGKMFSMAVTSGSAGACAVTSMDAGPGSSAPRCLSARWSQEVSSSVVQAVGVDKAEAVCKLNRVSGRVGFARAGR